MQFVAGVAFGILVVSVMMFVREVLREGKDHFAAGMAIGGIVYATVTLLAIIGTG